MRPPGLRHWARGSLREGVIDGTGSILTGGAAAVSSPELAGRRPELQLLRSSFEEAGAARPSLILVTGDAGLGKTRLARELEQIAAADGAITLRGQCLELSFGELPYAPVAGALRHADPAVLGAAVSELPADGRHELARAFPDVVSGAVGEPPRDDRFGQSRLFGWILALLCNLAARATVVLTIEDVHRADTSSQDFLRFLAQSLRSERLLVIATVRSDELHREHPVRRLVAELLPHESVDRVELGPLSEEAIHRQVAAILGTEPDPKLVRELLARAEGNPFYTEELLAAGATDGQDLPASLKDALLLRVDKLRPAAREVLRVVAAAGRPVDEALIERAAGLARDQVEAALRECIDHNVLVCDRGTDDYSVRHALVAEAVYGDLLPLERASLHRRIAGVLEQSASAANAPDRAHHWQLANEQALARRASIEAGMTAERAFGYSEALAHFERAVTLWQEHPDAAADTPLDLVDLLARAAQAARWTGESDRARELCGRALESFDHPSDPLRAAQLYERLGRYQPWDIDASLNAYRRAMSLLPESCIDQRMRLLVDEALALSFLGRWPETRVKAREAIALAQGEATAASESSAWALLGTAVAFLGDPTAGERHLRDALELAKRAGSAEDLVQIHLDLGEVLRLEGRIEEALHVMLDGEQVAVGVGALPYARFMSANAADDLLALGRWDELEERLQELRKQSLDRPAQLLMLSVAGRLDTARGRFDSAADRFESAVELCRTLQLVEFVPAVYSGYAELELWREQPQAARERIAEGLANIGTGENLLHVPMLHSTGARVEADLAEFAVAHRDTAGGASASEAARRHHERLRVLLEERGEAATPPEASAHLASCAAECSRALRTPRPGLWAEAATRWRTLENPHRVTYANYRHAEAQTLSRAMRSGSRRALSEAAQLSAELEAAPLSGCIQALARRARLDLSPPGGRPAPSTATPEVNPFGLTEREVEVLRLLGAGLTNREISEALFISQHTAGVHVSHILGKLGVANRVMAAAVAERLGMVSPG